MIINTIELGIIKGTEPYDWPDLQIYNAYCTIFNKCYYEQIINALRSNGYFKNLLVGNIVSVNLKVFQREIIISGIGSTDLKFTELWKTNLRFFTSFEMGLGQKVYDYEYHWASLWQNWTYTKVYTITQNDVETFKNEEVPPLPKDFDWKSWAITQKSKLDNFRRGEELNFYDDMTNGKLTGTGVLMGASIGFTVNSVKYTLDDIIIGTLTNSMLGKTFAEGIAKSNGIVAKVGGYIGKSLIGQVFKWISGNSIPIVGQAYMLYNVFTLLDKVKDKADFEQIQGLRDDILGYTNGTEGILTLGKTPTGTIIVDNWENSSYTGVGGQTTTGAKEEGVSVSEDIKDIIKGLKESLSSQAQKIADSLKALNISLTIPETASIPLSFDTTALENLFTTLKIPFDIVSLETLFTTLKIPFDITALEQLLTNQKIKIDTTNVNDLSLVLDSSSLIGKTIELDTTGLRDITANFTGSVSLTDSTLTLDETSVQGIKDIATQLQTDSLYYQTYWDSIKQRDDTIAEKQKTLLENDIANKEKNNKVLNEKYKEANKLYEGNRTRGDLKEIEFIDLHSREKIKTPEGVLVEKGYYSNSLVHEKNYTDVLKTRLEFEASKKFLDNVKDNPILTEEEAKVYGFKDIGSNDDMIEIPEQIKQILDKITFSEVL